MYFEVSARSGNCITQAFNEVAKKLTGIETNPISQSEIKSTGFTLNAASANAAGGDTKDKKDKAKGKKNCAC